MAAFVRVGRIVAETGAGGAAGVPASQRGGTVLGFLAGLIFGLAVAVVVAIFVTRTPVPFVNKVGKLADRLTEAKSPADAPDPNKPLYSRNKPATGASPEGGDSAAGTPTAPVPGAALPASSESESPATAPTPGANASAHAPANAPSDAKTDERINYLLQAGAFRSQEDADGMRAKLALIGFEARVLTAEVNGQTLYRVRIGPYAALDDLNRARAKLAETGIEASVVRQR
jgi:cell division protein FtsN